MGSHGPARPAATRCCTGRRASGDPPWTRSPSDTARNAGAAPGCHTDPVRSGRPRATRRSRCTPGKTPSVPPRPPGLRCPRRLSTVRRVDDDRRAILPVNLEPRVPAVDPERVVAANVASRASGSVSPRRCETERSREPVRVRRDDRHLLGRQSRPVAELPGPLQRRHGCRVIVAGQIRTTGRGAGNVGAALRNGRRCQRRAHDREDTETHQDSTRDTRHSTLHVFGMRRNPPHSVCSDPGCK